MIEFSEQLEKVMESRNFHIKGAINYSLSGKFQRFSDGSKHKRKKDLFVILHDYDRGATFGDWHYPDDWFTYWNINYEKPELAQRRLNKQLQIEKKAIQDYEKAKKQWRAKEFWNKFYTKEDPENHPYIVNKKIMPFYAKKCRSWLLIPVSDVNFNFITMQIIKPSGFKRLWKGTSQKNNMIFLCDKLQDDYRGVIRVCEGYATGCTIREITKSPVVCAINANNLLSVCVLLRRKFIHANIKICADNDKWGIDNPGLKYANSAAKILNCEIYYPDFPDSYLWKYPTDFNDLYVLFGQNETKKQLLMKR